MHVHVMILWNKKGGVHLFASHLAHGIPPLTVKGPRAVLPEGWAEHHLRQPNWPGIPPKGLSGTEATCPGSVSHQEGLRLFEEGLREEPGRILGRIVRDHGGSFPSTLTNLNRASRKKRPALDQTFCAPRRVLGLATG